jgi:hypothetical protein
LSSRLDARFVTDLLKTLIGDRADSEGLDAERCQTRE